MFDDEKAETKKTSTEVPEPKPVWTEEDSRSIARFLSGMSDG